MSAPQHTPGPWKIYPPRNAASHMPQIGSPMSDGTPYIVAQVCGGLGKHGRENNALLVAAAPELYEALRALYRASATAEPRSSQVMSTALQQACAALAKVSP